MNNKLTLEGLKLSALSFGCSSYWCRPYFQEQKALRLLSIAYENKINYFHTAPHYFLGEQRLGKFIKDYKPKDLIISTAIGPYLDNRNRHATNFDPKAVEEGIETSLKNLNIDSIDIAFLYPDSLDTLANEKLIERLIEIKKKGKVKYLGIFGMSQDIIEVLMPKSLEFKIFDVYFLRHTLVNNNQATIDILTNYKKLIINFSVISSVKNYFKINNMQSFWYFLRQLKRSIYSYDERLILLNDFSRKNKLENSIKEGLKFSLQNEKIHSTMINTCDENHLMENLQLLR